MKRAYLLLLVALALAPVSSARAAHSETGYIHTGVGSEQEARAYPCPRTAAGGWERTGPVVCFDKAGASWTIAYEPPGPGCTYTATGWSGNCIFDIDMGDHVKVWGTRGIPYTPFRIVWGHGAAPDEQVTSGGRERSGATDLGDFGDFGEIGEVGEIGDIGDLGDVGEPESVTSFHGEVSIAPPDAGTPRPGRDRASLPFEETDGARGPSWPAAAVAGAAALFGGGAYLLRRRSA